MEKVLRSLIHEKFPFELLVQLDLLSRRRYVINDKNHKEAKQEEIFKLLREFKIEGITNLAPGTNRYAFKLEGFVVKVATDRDGKIDNLKEFKMAKRLYPYVAKTYEVSENGILLVAEYIPPFESFTEMCKYADKIREILTKLSSVYLIGDVGITSKNYSNWGIRIGTDDPVCLDFAYVYEISSEYFICRKCKEHAMLNPNRDFTTLICSNPRCGKETTFEDIRGMIGNDLHRHEIGDLSKEGYLMETSNVLTTLTEYQSNYLVRRKDNKDDKKKTKVSEVSKDDFVMKHSPSYYIEIEKQGGLGNMNNVLSNAKVTAATIVKDDNRNKIPRQVTVKARVNGVNTLKKDVEPRGEYEEDKDKVVVKSVKVKSTTNQDQTSGRIAFSGKINNDEERNESSKPFRTITVHTKTQKPSVVVEESNKPAISDPEAIKIEVAVDESKIEEPVDITISEKPLQFSFNENFLKRIHLAISTLSNIIESYLHYNDIFAEAKNSIKDKKMYAETFYKCVQNAVFKALTILLKLDENIVPNVNDNGTHKEFRVPPVVNGTDFEPTLIFIARLWDDKELKSSDNIDIMKTYRSKYNDYDGIQREFIGILAKRLPMKLNIDNNGLDIILSAIADEFCATKFTEIKESTVTEKVVEEDHEMSEEEIEETVGPVNAEFKETMQSIVNKVYDEETDENNEEENDFQDLTSVTVYLNQDNTGLDVIRVHSIDEYGPVDIPLYLTLDEVDTRNIESMVDNRNGVWDWLINICPNVLFTTRDPEHWLTLNDYSFDESNIRIVILDENDEVYTMGIYYVEGMFLYDENGNFSYLEDIDDMMIKVSEAICSNLFSSVSHLRMTLKSDNILTEEYVESIIKEYSEEEEEEVETTETMSAAIKAAEDFVPARVSNNDTPVEEVIKKYEEEKIIKNSTYGEISTEDDSAEQEEVKTNEEDITEETVEEETLVEENKTDIESSDVQTVYTDPEGSTVDNNVPAGNLPVIRRKK